jgi:hypothetical protein
MKIVELFTLHPVVYSVSSYEIILGDKMMK